MSVVEDFYIVGGHRYTEAQMEAEVVMVLRGVERIIRDYGFSGERLLRWSQTTAELNDWPCLYVVQRDSNREPSLLSLMGGTNPMGPWNQFFNLQLDGMTFLKKRQVWISVGGVSFYTFYRRRKWKTWKVQCLKTGWKGRKNFADSASNMTRDLLKYARLNEEIVKNYKK